MSEDEMFNNNDETETDASVDFVTETEEDSDELNFYDALEDFLPTPENTDKVKKKFPHWLLSAMISALTCIVVLTIYSVYIIPKIRPTAVISYSGEQKIEETEDNAESGNIIGNVMPGIVTVSCENDFRSFFGISTQSNVGTGIVISENGYILTSNTLIDANGEALVKTSDGEFTAKIVGQDIGKDIAIIKIDKSGLTPVTLGDSSAVSAGDSAYVVGNLLGDNLGISVTKGIICGVNNNVSLSNGTTINIIQTDAVTGSLSSGGCVLNANGNVVGMITSAISSGNDNISLAIPSNDISMVAESLVDAKISSSGLSLGMSGSDAEHGVTVEAVTDDGPAKKAGLKKGDLILKVDDTVVKSMSEINKIRDMHKKGDILIFNVYRDGEILDINIKL